MDDLKYRRLDEDGYQVSIDGVDVFTVRRVWYRAGGWQWEVPEVLNGRVATRAPSRADAVKRAAERLRD